MECYRCNQWPCECGDRCALLEGCCLDTLAKLEPQSVHCCVTSPPYYALRDYGVDGQIGLEETLDEYIAKMVDVFRGVWRVLRDDGCLWLNIADSYASGGKGGGGSYMQERGDGSWQHRSKANGWRQEAGYKPKDMLGVPWQLAFALRADGWFLRDAVIWHKPSPMPSSQRDRCTNAYEFVFQLTKRGRYFFDMEAVKTKASRQWWLEPLERPADRGETKAQPAIANNAPSNSNPRNVWRIASEGYSEAHFATFPSALPAKCIKASTSEYGCCAACGAPWKRIVSKERVPTRPGTNTKTDSKTWDVSSIPTPDGWDKANVIGNRDPKRHTTETRTTGWEPTCDCECEERQPAVVLDPFSGAATTGIACRQLGRHYIGLELNPEYLELSARRLANEANRGDKRPKVKSLNGQMGLFE